MRPGRNAAALFMILAGVSVLLAQPRFEIRLTFSDGVDTLTRYFGVLPHAHFCIDPSDSINGHFEFEPPPVPPTGSEVLFRYPRSGSGVDCFGMGSPNDYRPFTNYDQSDTFRLNIYPYYLHPDSIAITWHSGLSTYFQSLVAWITSYAGLDSIDMLTQTSAKFSNLDIIVMRIHSQGPRGPTDVIVYPDTLTLEWANIFSDTLWVKNIGNAQLIVDTIYASPNDSLAERLNIQPQSFTVAPDDSQLVHVWEHSIIPLRGQYDFVESLYVVSNDPDDSLHVVVLRGVYSPLDEVLDTGEKVWRFELTQNYPNPFNPSTVINFQLATSNWVTLRVYDILGREVQTLVNEKKEAGMHEVRFDAKGVPSGVYIYRLTTPGATISRRMLLLR